MDSSIIKKRIGFFLVLLVIGVAYIFAAKLGLFLASVHESTSPVWPASGLAVAVIYLLGYRFWPLIFLGSFSANFLFTSVPILTIVNIAIGNTLECLLGCYLLQEFSNRRNHIGPFSQVVGISLGAVGGAAIAATIGTLSLMVSGVANLSLFGSIWLTWWMGDFLGILLFTPAILSFYQPFAVKEGWPFRRILKLILLCAITIIVNSFVFISPALSSVLFIVFPLILLGTACFGTVGTFSVAVIITVFSIWGTIMGTGPFNGDSLNQSLLLLQLFLASMALTAIILPIFRVMGHLLLPSIVLMVGWSLSGWLFASLDHERRGDDDNHFKSLISQAEQAIAGRMTTYEDAMRGGSSLFAASNEVSWDEWKTYIEASRIIDRYPGINGLGVVFPVKKDKLKNYLNQMKSLGVSSLTPFPIPGISEADRPVSDELYVISYIAPLDLNKKALGLDLASETNRKSAADDARDTGKLTMTHGIQLVQDEKKRIGFLVYVPMYQKMAPIETVEDRRKAFIGWVYAPFITDNFMSALLGNVTKEIELFIYEGSPSKTGKMIYRSEKDGKGIPLHFEKTDQIILAGQPFTLRWNKKPEFIGADNMASAWVAACSAFLSLLLAGLIVSLQSLESRARKLAEQRTTALRQQIYATKLSAKKLQKAREQLLQSQKMEAIGKLAGGVAHDFNNILAGILGYASLLKRKFSHDEKVFQQLEVIVSSAQRGSQLTKEILGFARKGKYELKAVNVNESIYEGIRLLSASIGKNISISTKLAKNIWPVEGDQTQILQTILNLGINARDAMPQGGVISITSENIKIEGKESGLGKGRYVRVCFADTGLGIPAEIRNKIFDPFFTTKERGQGTGLGLSTIYGIMNNHGGKIILHSSSECGTTFHLYFPAPAELKFGTYSSGFKELSTASLSGKTILVVDDEAILSSLLQEHLQGLGAHTHSAQNGKQAIEILRAHASSIDAMVLDVLMPEMSGMEVYQWMEKEGFTIPIVFASGYAESHEIIAARKNRHVSFIQKPFKNEDISNLLHQYFS